MGMPIDRLTIHGFKSIERLDEFPLGPINVLIGAGKSELAAMDELVEEVRSSGVPRTRGDQWFVQNLPVSANRSRREGLKRWLSVRL